MPGATVPQGYPYPLPADPGSADMAAGLQALAEAVDLDVQQIVNLTQQQNAFMVSRNSAQSIPGGGVGTNVTYTDVDYDNSGQINPNPTTGVVSIITPPGLWFIAARVTLPANAAGMHTNLICGVLGTVQTSHQQLPGGPITLTASGLFLVSPGDTATYVLANGAAGALVSPQAAMLGFRLAT